MMNAGHVLIETQWMLGFEHKKCVDSNIRNVLIGIQFELKNYLRRRQVKEFFN